MAQVQKEHVDEVSSWIHDEHHCVSLGAVSRRLGISRTAAQDVLRQVPKDQSYEVTQCAISESEEKGAEETIKTTGKNESDC